LMGVSVSVALMLLPLGLFYKYIYDKYGVNYAYALHFSTNITIYRGVLVFQKNVTYTRFLDRRRGF
jgi:hypothetical protein